MNNVSIETKLDANGNLIYHKAFDGSKFWYEYDKKGQCIHAKTNVHNPTYKSNEEWYEYDQDGNHIYTKTITDGSETEIWWYNGNIVSKREDKGYYGTSYTMYYDSGNLFYTSTLDEENDKESDRWYDENGNLIYTKDYDILKDSVHLIEYKNKNKVFEQVDEYKCSYNYTSDGALLDIKTSDQRHVWYRGSNIPFKEVDYGKGVIFYFDERGSIIRSEDLLGRVLNYNF